jgi:hypothetical protein
MGKKMIVYGTKIHTDINFPLKLPRTAETKYELKLSANPPAELINAITCGIPFYQAHGRRVYLYSNQAIDSSKPSQPWCYEIKDALRFYWWGGEKTIYYVLDKNGNSKLLSFWFIHLLLPLFFTLEHMYDFLHGGAVEVNSKPIMFIAPSMGGKSTLTDFFLKQGHTLISDDKIPTFIKNDGFFITGSHPYHRPYRKDEELGFHADNFMTASKHINTLYFLKKAEQNATINIHEITGYKKFDILFPNYLYMFNFLRTHRLHYLSKILNILRVFQISIPWDLHRLPDIHYKICNHLNSKQNTTK